MKRFNQLKVYTFALLTTLLFSGLALAQSVTDGPIPDIDPTKLIITLFEKVMSGDWAAVAAVIIALVTWASRAKNSPLQGWLLKLTRGYLDIKSDRGGAILVLVLGLAGGVVTALTAGSPITVALVVTCLKESILAAGGYALMKKLVFPADADVKSNEDKAVAEAKLAGAAVIALPPPPPQDPLNQ